jgi:hypothetical protein
MQLSKRLDDQIAYIYVSSAAYNDCEAQSNPEMEINGFEIIITRS